MPKLSDFENLITDNDLKRVLEKIGKYIVSNAIERLKEQSTYDGKRQLDRNSAWTLYYKASKGYDLRTGIMKDRSLIDRNSYNINVSGTKLDYKAIINVVGKALERIQTLNFWGETKLKEYMGWWIIDDWQNIVNEVTYEITQIIVKKLEKRLL